MSEIENIKQEGNKEKNFRDQIGDWVDELENTSESENLKYVEFGMEIHELENYLKGKSIAMIGLLDAIGYSPNGYNYLCKILHSLKLKPATLATFNAHFRTFHREFLIEDFITSNVSLKEIKKIQHQENNEKIKKILKETHSVQDKKVMAIVRHLFRIKESSIKKDDEQIFLQDIIKNYQDVNIFYSSNTGFIKNETSTYDIEKEHEQRKRNFDCILSKNPKAQIYTIGLIAPNCNEELKKQIEKENEFYKQLSTNFGTIYVDTAGVERMFKGECLSENGISNLALRCIKAMYRRKIQNPRNVNFGITQPITEQKNTGIDYLIEKSIERQKGNILLEKEQAFEEEYQKILKKTKEDC